LVLPAQGLLLLPQYLFALLHIAQMANFVEKLVQPGVQPLVFAQQAGKLHLLKLDHYRQRAVGWRLGGGTAEAAPSLLSPGLLSPGPFLGGTPSGGKIVDIDKRCTVAFKPPHLPAIEASAQGLCANT